MKISSNRNFGIVFFTFFLIIAIYPLLNNDEIRIWSLILAIIFLILGIFNSKYLLPLNRIWSKFGIILGKVISPIIMAFIFFGIVTPTTLVIKIFGKDLLRLKKKNKNNSYWINREKNNNNMTKQF